MPDDVLDEIFKTPGAPAPVRRTGSAADSIKRIFDEEGADSSLGLAMSRQEGGRWDTRTSGAGAQGPLQVIPATGLRYVKPEEWATPEGKIRASARYIKDLSSQFGDDPYYITAAYHAGEGKVKPYYEKGQPIPRAPEFYDKHANIYTPDHVDRVMSNLQGQGKRSIYGNKSVLDDIFSQQPPPPAQDNSGIAVGHQQSQPPAAPPQQTYAPGLGPWPEKDAKGRPYKPLTPEMAAWQAEGRANTDREMAMRDVAVGHKQDPFEGVAVGHNQNYVPPPATPATWAETGKATLKEGGARLLRTFGNLAIPSDIPYDQMTPAEKLVRDKQRDYGQQSQEVYRRSSMPQKITQKVGSGVIGAVPPVVATMAGVPAPLAFGANTTAENLDLGAERAVTEGLKAGLTVGLMQKAQPLITPLSEGIKASIASRLVAGGLVGTGAAAMQVVDDIFSTGNADLERAAHYGIPAAVITALLPGSGGQVRSGEYVGNVNEGAPPSSTALTRSNVVEEGYQGAPGAPLRRNNLLPPGIRPQGVSPFEPPTAEPPTVNQPPTGPRLLPPGGGAPRPNIEPTAPAAELPSNPIWAGDEVGINGTTVKVTSADSMVVRGIDTVSGQPRFWPKQVFEKLAGRPVAPTTEVAPEQPISAPKPIDVATERIQQSQAGMPEQVSPAAPIARVEPDVQPPPTEQPNITSLLPPVGRVGARPPAASVPPVAPSAPPVKPQIIPPFAPQAPAKEPWEMTKAEYEQRQSPAARRQSPAEHRNLVLNALLDGKPVPEQVLNDYPVIKTQAQGMSARKPQPVAPSAPTPTPTPTIHDILSPTAEQPAISPAPAQRGETQRGETAGAVPAKPANAGGFDSEAWNAARDETIRASRASGNVHLDKVQPYVETMRGKEIYYAHDPNVRGVIRTVDNRGNVYVNWSDKYSADKESASETTEKVGRKTKTVFQTTLGPTDLKDYVFAKTSEPKSAKAKGKGTAQPEPSPTIEDILNPQSAMSQNHTDNIPQNNVPVGAAPSSAKESDLTDAGWNKKDLATYTHADGRTLRREGGKWVLSGEKMRGGKLRKPKKYATLKDAIADLAPNAKPAQAATPTAPQEERTTVAPSPAAEPEFQPEPDVPVKYRPVKSPLVPGKYVMADEAGSRYGTAGTFEEISDKAKRENRRLMEANQSRLRWIVEDAGEKIADAEKRFQKASPRERVKIEKEIESLKRNRQEVEARIAPTQAEPQQKAEPPVTEPTPKPEAPKETAPASPTAKHVDLFDRVEKGEATAAEFKAAFDELIVNKDAIKAELSALTKDGIFEKFPNLRWRYKNDKKSEVVDAAYSDMLSDFSLSNSVSYVMGQGSYEQAVRNLVAKVTDESLAAHAEKIKQARAERQKERDAALEGMKDPQTLEDYVRILKSKMSAGASYQEARKALTPEQRATFDDLAGAKSRDERRARADQQKTEVRAASQSMTGQVIETKHTKTGEPLFVVKTAERVERDVYNQWNATAKRLGGWYSSFRGAGAVPGFQFKTRDNADAFLEYLGGKVEKAKEAVEARRDAMQDDKSQTAVERLREMADNLDEQATEALSVERQANTERRARFAANAEAAANADKAMAATMRNIAEAIESGKAKFLDRVRQKVQVEMLQTFVRSGYDEYLRAEYPTYAEQEKHRAATPPLEAADYAQFPTYTAYRSDLAKLGRQLSENEGTKKLGASILKVADDVTDAYLKFAKENLHKVSTFSRKDGKAAVFPSKGYAETAIARSGYKGQAIVLPVKRGENIIILSPSAAREKGIWEGDNDARIELSPEIGDELVEKLKRQRRREFDIPWTFEAAHERRKRLAGMGIETPAELRAALREFIKLRKAPKAPDKIKEMERAMVGRRNDGLDFFPTPAGVADEMIATADIKEGMSVLEPSAGMGHIADRLREAGFQPDVMEFSSDRRDLLKAKGYYVLGSDFMDITPRGFTYGDVFKYKDGRTGVMRGSGGMGSGRVGFIPEGKTDREFEWVDREDLTGVRKMGSNSGYDRILMNPPFSERRDVEHVRHAYDLLKPGGRVVAIMGEGSFFGSDKKATAFREWLESVGGTSEKLDEGTFLDPSLPVNTGVNARMVVIDKPEGKTGAQPEVEASAPPEERKAAPAPAPEVIKPTPTEQRTVAKAASTEKIDPNTGFTKSQGEYVASTLKEELPKLQDGQPITVEVPGDGKFTARTPEGANNLYYKLTGKSLISGQRPTVARPVAGGRSDGARKVESMMRSSSERSSGLPAEVGEDVRGVFPIEQASTTGGWAGNISPTPEFVTDGHAMILASAIGKRSTLLSKTVDDGDEAGKARRTPARIQETWNNAVKAAQKTGTIEGAFTTGTHAGIYAVVTAPRMDAPLVASAAKFKTILDSTEADEVRVKDATSPVVFYKGGQPVAILMPFRLEKGTVVPLNAMRAAVSGKKVKGQEPEFSLRTRADVEESSEFKKWFAGSKVVDEEGKPLIVYHGTHHSFDQFNPDMLGANVRNNTTGLGFFFADTAMDADTWHSYKPGELSADVTPGANIMPVYLSLRNPKRITSAKFGEMLASSQRGTIARMRARAEADGYDGFQIERGSGKRWYVAFRPNQIKSATGNDGNFDPNDDRINFAKTTAPKGWEEAGGLVQPERVAHRWNIAPINEHTATMEQLLDGMRSRIAPPNRARHLPVLHGNGATTNVLEKIGQALGWSVHSFAGVNLSPDAVDAIVERLTAAAFSVGGTKATNLMELAGRFRLTQEQAKKAGYNTIQYIDADDTLVDSFVQRIEQHEIVHAEQHKIGQGNSQLVSDEWVKSDPDFRQLSKALKSYGGTPRKVAVEAIAFIASGDHERMGYTGKDGMQRAVSFARRYFQEVAHQHGAWAIKQFRYIRPEFRKAIKEVAKQYEQSGQGRDQISERGNGRESGMGNPSQASAPVKPGNGPAINRTLFQGERGSVETGRRSAPVSGESRGRVSEGRIGSDAGSDRTALAVRQETLPDFSQRDFWGVGEAKSAVDTFGKWSRESLRDVRSVVNPMGRGLSGEQTASITRERAAEMARKGDQADEKLKEARKILGKLPEMNRRAFVYAIETGETDKLPAQLQGFAATIRELLDGRRDEVQSLGKGKLQSFYENYFPHIWKDPEKANQAFMSYFAKRPFEGSKSFLKQRTIPTIEHGIALGLEPVSTNPVDLVMLKLREMDRYIMAHRVMDEMKDKGLLTRIKATHRVPPGYAKLDDKVSTIYGEPTEKGTIKIRGFWIAPEPAANVVNNYLSPGLRKFALFRGYLALANIMNQFQLGVSFFHFGFTSLDAAISKAALAMQQLAYGRPLQAAKSAVQVPVAPITTILKGRKVYKAWIEPGSQGPEWDAIASAAQAGGGRMRQDQLYATQMTKKMKEGFAKKNLPGVAGGLFRMPFAAIEQISRPLMEYLVPRQKAGVFAELARLELERLGPNATREDVRKTMAKVWDSVDNRMGQLVYDNLFWNKTFKDVLMGSVRSVGWNLGTKREVIGGASDFVKFGTNVLARIGGRGGGKLPPGGTPPTSYRSGGDWFSGKPEFTYRMGYVIALPIVVGLVGAMINYLMTGERPKDLEDCYFPRTGSFDENGKPNRISLPSYMKDIYHYYIDPKKTVVNKLHPALNTVAETLSNKDFYGTEIYNPDDPPYEVAKDVLKHITGSFEPFAIRGLREDKARQTGAPSWFPFVGLTPAPKSLNQSKAERLMDELNAEHRPMGSRTKEQAEQGKLKADIVRTIRRGGEEEGRQMAQDAIAAGKLSGAQMPQIERRAHTPGIVWSFTSLSLSDALKVWSVATDEERRALRPALEKKVGSSLPKMSDEDRQRLLPRAKEALNQQ